MTGKRRCNADGPGAATRRLKRPGRLVSALGISLLALALGRTGLCTGYYGPIDYLSHSQESIQASPEFYWELEVKRLARDFHPPEKLRPDPAALEETGKEKTAALLGTTADADLADFEAALKGGQIKPPDPAKATEEHRAARERIAATDEKRTDPLPEEFASEFADYHRGAFAFRLGSAHWEEARKAWTALLARPAGERHYRSVWAAFMLGKIAMKSGDFPEAIRRFRQTRALAHDGFADSLGLAADSYGWEGRCEWKAGRSEKAAPLFLTQLALGDESAVASLKALIPGRKPVEGMLNYDAGPDEKQNLKAAAADPLLRRLVTVHILATAVDSFWSERSPADSARCGSLWLAAVREAKPGKLPDAEYLGWVAYNSAAYEEAAHWLALAQGDTPAAEWLRSKLERRAGHLQEAAKSMERAWRTLIRPGAYTGWKPAAGGSLPKEAWDGYYSSDWPSLPFSASASGELGLLRLARNDFVQAMDVFLKGRLWADAAYVAERVLSADELKAYVDRQAELPAADPGLADQNARLRYLLGRRLVREKRYREAARYLKAPYGKLLARYLQARREGADETLPRRKRADGWLAAAWLARFDGMELMGTEAAPDGFETGGANAPDEIARQRQSGHYTWGRVEAGQWVTTPKPMVLPASHAERRRLARHKISPDVRFHYRIIAAKLAEKGARLLDDNSEELADVLNTAGLWVKERDEKFGDHLYFLLEKRCPNTEIGKAVLARHWFVDDREGPWRRKQSVWHQALCKELGLPDPAVTW